MTTSSFFKFLCLGLLVIQIACNNEDPTVEVSGLFESYQKAIADKQYEKASYMLDQKTAQYYERLVDLAMNEERSKLEALNFKSKLIALALRQGYSKKELQALDGRQVFAYAAEHKINALDSVELYSIAKIVMDADFSKAAARMKRKGELTKEFLKFNKEGTDWKVNFAGIMNESNSQQTSVEVTGIKAENKRIISILKDISGKRIKSNIWTPAKRW